MQIFGSQIISKPVMDLQTGQQLAVLFAPIINPDNLRILAYVVSGPRLVLHPSLIRVDDIRDITNNRVVIDDSDDIVGVDDIVRLKKIIQIDFRLVGIKVVDDNGRKIGKVNDYTIDVDNFYIVQLYIQNNKLTSFNESTIIVHRDQIIEVSDKDITIKSASLKEPKEKPVFVNPFGKSQRQLS